MEMFQTLIMTVRAQLYAFVQAHQVVHFKWVYFVLCTLCFSTAIQEKFMVPPFLPALVLHDVPGERRVVGAGVIICVLVYLCRIPVSALS